MSKYSDISEELIIENFINELEHYKVLKYAVNKKQSLRRMEESIQALRIKNDISKDTI